jgi:serine/threonine-protein kinase
MPTMSSSQTPLDKTLTPSGGCRHDEACERFRAAWKAATDASARPRIEDYLAAVPEAERSVLLGALVQVDIRNRRRAGEELQSNDYTARFPDLPSSWLDGALKAAPAAAPPAAGSLGRLGRFELVERVGQGTFGDVWRAFDTELRRAVALKVPHPGVLDQADVRERFEREARAAAQLRHPGLVSVHEVARLPDGSAALVADFIEGPTLRDLLAAGPLPPREAAALAAAQAEALDYAHRRGVVHRDVKPGNILVEIDDGAGGASRLRPMLTDFGLAMRAEGEPTVIQEGYLVGTPAYMSPEAVRAQGHRIDRRSDVYSLGAVLYEMLSGVPPFAGAVLEILSQVLNHEPERPRMVNPTVPADLEGICLKCLEKEPARRYASAGELAEDLHRYLRGEPVRARPSGPVNRTVRWARRRPVAAALLVALLLLPAAGAAALYVYQEAQKARHERAIAQAQGFTRLLGDLKEPNPGERDVPSAPELDALWELAQVDNPHLGPLFIEQALADPAVAERLGRRAEPGAIAAVGLDPARRQKVLEILQRKLASGNVDPRVGKTCVLLGWHLGANDPAFARSAVRIAVERITQGVGAPEARPEGVHPGLDFGATPQELELRTLADAVAALAKALPAEDAAEDAMALAAPLDAPLTKTRNRVVLAALLEALVGLAAQLQPIDAAVVTSLALDRLTANIPAQDQSLLAKTVARAVARLDPPQAAAISGAVGQWLFKAMTEKRPSNRIQLQPYEIRGFAEGIADVAGRLDSGTAAAMLQPVLEALAKTHDDEQLAGLRKAILALVERITPDDAAKTAPLLLGAMDNPGQPVFGRAPGIVVGTQGEVLAALTGKMSPDAAGPLVEKAAHRLVNALGKANDTRELMALGTALAKLAPHMKSADCSATAAAIFDALARVSAFNNLSGDEVVAALTAPLAPLTARLQAADAVAPARHALLAMAGDGGRRTKVWVDSIPVLLQRLNPDEASALALELFHKGGRGDSHDDLFSASDTFAKLGPLFAARLKSADAAIALERVVERQVAQRTNTRFEMRRMPFWAMPLSTPAWAEVEAILQKRLMPADARAAAQRLLPTFDKVEQPAAVEELAAKLGAMAAALDADEAATVSATAAQRILDIMELADKRVERRDQEAAARLAKAKPPVAQPAPGPARVPDHVARLQVLRDVVVALAPRMSPDVAALATQRVQMALRRTTNPAFLGALGEMLAALAARLKPDEVAPLIQDAAPRARDALAKATDIHDIQALCRMVAALAPRLKPDDAAALVNLAVQKSLVAIIAADQPLFQIALADTLATVVPLMRPEDVSPAVGKALDSLARAVKPGGKRALSKAVTALASRLTADEADAVGQRLLAELSKAGNPSESFTFGELVVALAARMKPDEAQATAATATKRILDILAKSEKPGEIAAWGRTIAGLAARMKAEDAANVAGVAAKRAREALPKAKQPMEVRVLADAVATLAPRIKPDDAAVAADAAVQRMGAVLASGNNPGLLRFLADVVPPLVPWLRPADAATAARRALEDLGKAKTAFHQKILGRVVAVLAVRMPPDDAAPIARDTVAALVAALPNEQPYPYLVLDRPLALLAPRLTAVDAAAAARRILDGMTKDVKPLILKAQSEAIADLLTRLKPADAAAIAQDAAKRVTAGASRGQQWTDLCALEEAVAVLAAHMKPDDAAAVARAILQRFDVYWSGRAWYPAVSRLQGDALGKLMKAMKPDEATTAAGKLAQHVFLDMTRTDINGPQLRYELKALGDVLAALTERMPLKDASAKAMAVTSWAVDTITRTDPLSEDTVRAQAEARRARQALIQAEIAREIHGLAEAIIPLTTRLKPADAKAAAQRLLEQRLKMTELADLAALGAAVGKLAERLDPEQAGTLAKTIMPSLVAAVVNDATRPEDLQPACRQLAVLVVRLQPDDAKAAARQALEAMAGKTDGATLGALGKTIEELARRMKAEHAAAIAAKAALRILDAKSPTKFADSRGSDYQNSDIPTPAQALAALAPFLPSEAAAAALPRSLELPYRLDPLGASQAQLEAAVVALAARLQSADAGTTALAILKAPGQANDTGLTPHLALKVVASLAPRMTPDDALAVAQAILELMAKAKQPDAQVNDQDPRQLMDRMNRQETAARQLPDQVEALAALIVRLKPDEAAAIAKTAAPYAVRDLPNRFPYMEQPDREKQIAKEAWAKAAATLCGQLKPDAAAALVHQLVTTIAKLEDRNATGVNPPPPDAALAALAERLDPASAATEIRRALDGMAKPAFQPDLNTLGKMVETLASRVKPIAPLQWTFDAIAQASNPSALPPLHAVATALGANCATPELLEALKQPTCAGETRRLVLLELEKRENRAFNSAWQLVDWLNESARALELAGPARRWSKDSMP